ncbi:MAG: amidase [Chloroflexi bacterium]|nr:amidase [Chloroflexota bacterium]MBV9603019.1 amidase [Chloroflexota bacterium]
MTTVSARGLADLTAAELLDLYRRGDASPVEAVEACLGRIQRLDPSVGAVLTLLVERSIARAEESTRRWREGEARPLEGIPFGLKDIIATKDIRSTGGSPLYTGYVPTQSATLAERLEAAGGVLVAKLNTFEFAAGSNATSSNPWDLDRWPAGSSSGSTVAVAAHELPIAIGTDTGGSIAIPAAFCGVVGLKPTFGRIPRTGIMPLSWTLDHAGPLSRSALDAALVLRVMAGADPRDPTSASTPVDDYAGGINAGLDGIRIGVPTDWFFAVCDPQVELATRAAIRLLEQHGARVGEVPFPSTRRVDLHAIELTIIYAELASLHEVTFDRLEQYGEEFQHLLVRAQFTSAVDYLKALRARHLVQLDFQNAFAQFDALIVPGGVCTAPRHDQLVAKLGSEERPLIDVISRPTAVMDITGIPALTIPAGFDRLGLPIGMQIATRPYDEATGLRIGHAYQQLTDFHRVLPPIVRSDLESGRDQLDRGSLPPVVLNPVVTATRDRVW